MKTARQMREELRHARTVLRDALKVMAPGFEATRLVNSALVSVEACLAPSRGACRVCGGTRFLPAVDNQGQSYMGCATCVVVVTPVET